jgi:hypothetical protein
MELREEIWAVALCEGRCGGVFFDDGVVDPWYGVIKINVVSGGV